MILVRVSHNCIMGIVFRTSFQDCGHNDTSDDVHTLPATTNDTSDDVHTLPATTNDTSDDVHTLRATTNAQFYIRNCSVVTVGWA